MGGGLGDALNEIVRTARYSLFNQGELAQLSHSAFELAAARIQEGEDEELTISYPIGYKATKEPILGSTSYKKDDLIGRYAFLAHTQIPVNGIYQLSTIVEALLTDLVRTVVIAYPAKISAKRKIGLRDVLKAGSLEEVQLRATDGLLQELSYKSPKDFAEEIDSLLSLNLLECPAYHTFIEMKATRDVYIHNQGVANEAYTAKSGSHARVQAGEMVPVGQVYFLEVYEACLQFTEWLEAELHAKWHSSQFETQQEAAKQLAAGDSNGAEAGGGE